MYFRFNQPVNYASGLAFSASEKKALVFLRILTRVLHLKFAHTAHTHFVAHPKVHILTEYKLQESFYVRRKLVTYCTVQYSTNKPTCISALCP